MDTASHILLGVTLGGLATIDPSVSDTGAAAAVMMGTILASNAPDLDTVLRLRGMNSIRHHRGITHSLPGLLIWPVLVTALFWLSGWMSSSIGI